MVRLERIRRFGFAGREFDPATGHLRLRYRLDDGERTLELVETFDFGPGDRLGNFPGVALDAALDLLHWIAGVSYWKLACRGRVEFGDRRPTSRQASALETVYREGLAELAWRNGIGRRYWPDFASCTAGPDAPPAGPAGLARRALVPMGGGKDSLVALERVRAAGIGVETVQVGSAALIGRVAARTGLPHWIVRRRLAPELAGLNERSGAINGHVPITAINAAALVVAALLWDFDAVVFANERSADTPTLVAADGREINHQFSKSRRFEELFAGWVRHAVASDLDVFSILRGDRELAVCREFAGLERYHDVFSSCNRNFHLAGPRTGRWCCDCPKCRFVFLALAPFMDPESLRRVFGRDLLAEPGQESRFAELLELDGPRPFECVGEAGEARAAVSLLAGDPRWRDRPVVRALEARLAGHEVPAPESLLAAGSAERIPERFTRASG
ncbi:MAG: hypothetical protein RQ847_06545 [Wenzhouxiangellaceae bacterium]|nr:hypothetical protein [Wenzhouxiangellaceae bacterium]